MSDSNQPQGQWCAMCPDAQGQRPSFPTLVWKPGTLAAPLEGVVGYVDALTTWYIDWYERKRASAKRWAKLFRTLAILATAGAGLVPVLAEILKRQDGTPWIPPLCTALLVGLAALFIAIDSFWGYTRAWVRYMRSKQELSGFLDAFHLDWEQEKLSWNGKDPAPDRAEAWLGGCSRFLMEVHSFVREETEQWATDFQAAVSRMDQAAREAAQEREAGRRADPPTNTAPGQ